MRRLLPLGLLLFASPLLADDTDVTHVKLDIEIDPVARTVGGTSTLDVESTVAGLSTFTFRLYSSFQVSAARCNGAAATFTRPTDDVVVTLDRPYNIGERFQVSVDYSGSPPSLGFSSFTFSSHSGAPIIASLSEPWYAYTWWPCKESLTDKFTVEMWITVPNNLVVATNGMLQGTDTLSGNRLRYRHSHTYPIITYGVSVAISNYQTRTDTFTYQGANMPVEFYVYPERWSSSVSGMNLIVPMLQAFTDAYGEYPFINEKYGIAQFSWGGGMEHQTITSQSSFSEWLSAHELAHSWWGNMITCATWHDIWLNEGFATQGEAIYYEFVAGGTIQDYHNRMRVRRPSNRGGTVYVYSPNSVGTIFSSNNVYRKGAWVVHQLRGVVGDQAFFQLLADWRTAKAYSSCTTAEFTAIASTSVGYDLAWFIDQCVMDPGAPAYEYGWQHEVVGGQDYVFLHVGQTQDNLGWDRFRFPIEIRVQTPSGTESHKVWCDNWRDEHAIAVQGTPSSVNFDPDDWILKESTRQVAYVPSLRASSPTLPYTGGSVTFALDAGQRMGQRPYLLLGSMSGITPGIAIPGEKTLPLAWDLFSLLALNAVNSSAFQGFTGTLNASGQAAATLTIPMLDPTAVGVETHFAFITLDEPYYTSLPVGVTIN